MLLIFSKVLVVFIYIGVGFIANRLKVLPEESVKHFISLVMGITEAQLSRNIVLIRPDRKRKREKHSCSVVSFTYRLA